MSLDVVIPAFNEQDRIGRTLAAYQRAFPDRDTRFLVALDGCSDATADIVRELRERDERIELLEFPKLGKGGVILESFRHGHGEVVAFVDADCATPPGELARLIELAFSRRSHRSKRARSSSLAGRVKTSHPSLWGSLVSFRHIGNRVSFPTTSRCCFHR